MLRKNLKILCVTLFLLGSVLLPSCARVEIRDMEWCGDMGSEGASCFMTVGDQERDIPQPEWDSERFGMICGKSKEFIEMKKAILKLCKLTWRCTIKEQNEIENFFFKVGEYDKERKIRFYDSISGKDDRDTI